MLTTQQWHQLTQNTADQRPWWAQSPPSQTSLCCLPPQHWPNYLTKSPAVRAAEKTVWAAQGFWQAKSLMSLIPSGKCPSVLIQQRLSVVKAIWTCQQNGRSGPPVSHLTRLLELKGHYFLHEWFFQLTVGCTNTFNLTLGYFYSFQWHSPEKKKYGLFLISMHKIYS